MNKGKSKYSNHLMRARIKYHSLKIPKDTYKQTTFKYFHSGRLGLDTKIQESR